MNISFSRRRLLQVAALGASAVAVARAAPAAPRGDFAARIAELEAREGGRLGVALFNGGAVQGHRLGERFAMCSTFKFVASALILERVQAGEERLDRAIRLLRTGSYPATPGPGCSWCPFATSCPAKAAGAQVVA